MREAAADKRFSFTIAAQEILADLRKDLDAIFVDSDTSAVIGHLDFSSFEHSLHALEQQNQQLELALAEAVDERNALIYCETQMNVILDNSILGLVGIKMLSPLLVESVAASSSESYGAGGGGAGAAHPPS